MKQIDKITIILTVFIMVFTGVLFFGAVNSEVGAGAGEVREQLNQAAGAQHQVTTGVSNAQDTAKELTGEINQAGTTVGRLEGEVQSSGELIADCQRILAEVRRRGTKNQEKIKATKEYWVWFGNRNVYFVS